MCERIIETNQMIIRHEGMIFVGPLKEATGETVREFMGRHIDWMTNEVMADHRFPSTACSCNHPDIVAVEREIEINGETVRIIANERV